MMTTPEERRLMRHALGLDQSEKPYRNHYSASPGHHSWAMLEALCSRGLMVSAGPGLGGDYVFAVTDAGKAAL